LETHEGVVFFISFRNKRRETKGILHFQGILCGHAINRPTVVSVQ